MLVNYFLILIMLLLMSGLVIDAGVLEWRQLQLQTAADAAAQEASFQLARGDSAWSTAAQAQAAANGSTNGASGVTVTLANPPKSGLYTGDPLAVQATVSKSVTNIFMSLVNGGKSTVGATAVAREVPTCLWITNPSSSTGGALTVASGNINANCGVYISTATGTSITVDTFSKLKSLRTRIAGPSSSSTSTGTMIPQPHYVSASKSDPLAYITAPSSTFSCNYNASVVANLTMTSGPFNSCGGLTISNSNLTLTSGLYIVADGMTINNSTITATSGVTFYFTKHTSASYTPVTFNNSNLYIKAPTTAGGGGIVGVAVFGDRGWVAHGAHGLSFNGGVVVSDGVWYIPNTGLYLWSTPFSCYKYDVLYLDNLYTFGSTSTLSVDYSDLSGVSPLHYEDGVLVQ